MSARTRGFSLVELLIAMVLGLMLIGGTTTIFLGNIRSAELSQSIASIQANARFALDEMAAGLRVAGSRGCASTGRALTVSADDAPLDEDRPNASALLGARVTAADWIPDVLGTYTPPVGRGAPIIGTDALLVQYGQAPGETVTTTMDSVNDTLGIPGTMNGLGQGDLAIVTDCAESDVFRIDTRTAAPGGVTLTPEQSLSRSYGPSADVSNPKSVRVLPFTSVFYYVGESGRSTRAGDAVRSLFMQRSPFDPAVNPPLELAEGVDQMRLSFAVSGAGGVRLHATDGAAFEPGDVSAVSVGLLMSSAERLDNGTEARVYEIAGHVVHPEGNATPGVGVAFHPGDRRLRVPFERNVSIRNRTLTER